jgi:hypothetical protein
MHSQILSDKINIFLQIFLYLFYLNSLLGTAGYAFGQLLGLAYAVIAFRIQVRNKILKDNPKRAGYRTTFTAGTAHFITLNMPVGNALEGIVITGINARCFLAVAANSSKCSVFAQRSDAVILRMVKIIAGYLALPA